VGKCDHDVNVYDRFGSQTGNRSTTNVLYCNGNIVNSG
jgi:hypothetical protein